MFKLHKHAFYRLSLCHLHNYAILIVTDVQRLIVWSQLSLGLFIFIFKKAKKYWKTCVLLLVYCIKMWGAGQAPRRLSSIAGSNNMSRNPSRTIIQSEFPARYGLFMVVHHHHLRQSFSLCRTWRARAGRGGTQAVRSLVHGEVKFDNPVAISKQKLLPGSG